MKAPRALAVVLAALTLLGAGGGEPTTVPAGAPTLADRLAWNARERTSRGIAALAGDRAAEAAAALDTAWHLEPGSPVAAYNAGSARLAAGRPDALPALEAAARAALAAEGGWTLATDALYNLGNARFAAGDAAGAVEAYTAALRRDGDRLDAKHNLELALRRLDEQRQQRDPAPPPGGESDEATEGADGDADSAESGDPGEDADAERPGEDDGAAAQPPPESAPQQAPEPQPGNSSSGGAAQEGDKGPEPRRDAPLPDFRDQPGMSAEQAAALLDAVENLERQQRLDRARGRRSERAAVEKDW